MTLKLSDELRNALNQQPDWPLQIEDERTKNVYVLLDADAYYRLVNSQDIASIRRGIEQMEAGHGRPLADADADMRRKLGFPPRS